MSFCPKSKSIYLQLLDVLRVECGLSSNMLVNPCDILFGYQLDEPWVDALNHILLITKQFLYTTRCKGESEPKLTFIQI